MQYVVKQHYKLEVTICQYMDQLPASCTGLHTLCIKGNQHAAYSHSQIRIYDFRPWQGSETTRAQSDQDDDTAVSTVITTVNGLLLL